MDYSYQLFNLYILIFLINKNNEEWQVYVVRLSLNAESLKNKELSIFDSFNLISSKYKMATFLRKSVLIRMANEW